MFFLTYVRRELRRRMRQAIFIAIGLAVGIGLVITVIGASSGVKAAQAKVLRALYGVGTDITVTTKPKPRSTRPTTGHATSGGPAGGSGGGPRAEICLNGKCHTSGTVDALVLGDNGTLSQSEIARIAGLHDVSAAAGGLVLTDNRIVLPSASNPQIRPPTSFTVDGTDITSPRLGPLSNARLTSGRAFTAADQNSDVALVDASYAAGHDIKPGSTTLIGGTRFTVIGLVSQPEASSPPDMYVPLARAQALTTDPATGKSMKGLVDAVYVTAASAADIGTVQQQIEHLLPQATVTSSSDLAGEITGSAASAAKLAGALGKWLAVLVLIAAFAVASLLTMAAVARRVPEFGTLKALGWRGSRIVGQVLGESLTTGIIGGLAGIGLGFAGVAIIDKIAPQLSATVPSASGALGSPQTVTGPGGAVAGSVIGGPSASHTTIAVPMSASVTIGAIMLAVLLAIAGGLLAGSFGGWRAARLRPAAALARVALSGRLEMDPGTDIYRLTGVSRTYRKSGREILAVRELDLDIRAGEWLAVQGRTGHGKTTLLQLLGGLDRPTEGRVTFAGLDLATAPEAQVRKVRAGSFGFIFQTFNLVPTLSAYENVEAALIPLGVHVTQRRGRVRAALDSVGLGDRAQHLPGELSGGQQQRVAIARALVKQPRVLLADEPTGNLDEDTRDEIIDLLDTLWRERRLTLVLVSHDSSVVRRAQRIGVMSRGRLSIRADTRA